MVEEWYWLAPHNQVVLPTSLMCRLRLPPKRKSPTRMHDFPVAVDATKHDRLVASIVYFPAISFCRYLELDVRNRPGEIAFNVGFNVVQVQFKRL